VSFDDHTCHEFFSIVRSERTALKKDRPAFKITEGLGDEMSVNWSMARFEVFGPDPE
jgi:hypothetical protein